MARAAHYATTRHATSVMMKVFILSGSGAIAMSARHVTRASALAPLAEYGIDSRSGFVPVKDPIEHLSAVFGAWEAIVPDLSPLIRSRRLRHVLSQLELIRPSDLTTTPERERALLLLSVFANAWVWGGDTPNVRIPPQISVPLWDVASALNRPPIVHYASMALNNWRRLDGSSPLSMDNAQMQVRFLGGVDEDWFFICSLGVELAGAPLLPTVHAVTLSSHDSEDAELSRMVEQIPEVFESILAALARMREWCDPHAYYLRVRPFLAGWPAPGAIYEGISDEPKRFFGGSAGQSSLIQLIDALLGVTHDDRLAGPYLREIRRYMPLGHRRFVEDVERISRLRQRATVGSASLRHAYNRVVEQLLRFRRLHMTLTHEYIVGPSGMRSGEQGTGGTTFVDFLGDAERCTTAARLGPEAESN